MEITRVDMTRLEDGQTLVLKYQKDWKVGKPPVKSYKTDVPIEEMIEWFEDQFWDVLDWGIGARAFKYERRPVRTKRGIKRKRKEVRRDRKWYNDKGVNNTHALNLAFYL